MSFFKPKTYRKEIPEIVKLAIPIILGQLGTILMGVIDTMMVGKLGTVEMASVNQANNIFFMLSGLTFGILFSVSTLVSIKVGEGQASDGYRIYRASLVVGVILSLLQMAVIYAIIGNFHWLHQPASVNAISPQFLKILGFSILPILITMCSRQFTDGLGHTWVFMVITIGGLLLNTFLNWVLIWGKLGFPEMGVMGSAYATTISRYVMAIAGLIFVRYSKLMKSYLPKIMPSYLSLKTEFLAIWKLGLPLGLQTFAEWACFAISGLMVGWADPNQMAAHTVALNVASVTYMVASGIAIAGSILVGNSYGEHDRPRILRIAYATFFLLTIFELINALGFVLFNEQIAALYKVDSQVMPYILPLMFLASLFQLADGIQAGAMSLLRGVKDVVWASIIAIISYWVVSLPLSYYLGSYRIQFHALRDGGLFHIQKIADSPMGFEHVYGIWVGFTVGLFMAALFGVYRFFHHLKKVEFI